MERHEQYWRTNLRYLIGLLIIWFIVAQVCPVLAADYLNQFKIGGFPLGIWFAFQGSIIFFVILLFVYNYLMNRLEKKYGIDE